VSLIKRYIVEQNERKEVQNTLDLSKAKTIFEVLKEEDKIVLLGNPGIGKTIELKRIAVEYWHDQENTFIPIFRNLKNFTKQDTLDSYISINYKSIENVCFVFDGIDEISDIQDFESKLQTFIKSLKNPKHKIIISCRANVFQSSVKKIDNFKVYNLKDLTLYEGLTIL
ncbi:NACHT domain-containing protein, partial [Tenacibaculum maritimum]